MAQTSATETLAQTASKRWGQIRKSWVGGQIGYGLLLLAIGALIGRYVIFPADEGYNTNLFTEALSVGATILVLDRLSERRADARRKDELMYLLGSEDNSTAREAARLLRHKGWLTDGSLKGANLAEANLEGADLEAANLEGVDLRGAKLHGAFLVEANLEGADLGYAKLHDARLERANLEGAVLRRANLEGAVLTGAKLHGADLVAANLQGAFLWVANLEGADLWVANLHGADLSGAKLHGAFLWEAKLHGADLERAKLHGAFLVEANLEGADLVEANLHSAGLWGANLEGADLSGAKLDGVTWQWQDEETLYTATLPDGTKWTAGTDMGRFTDKEHPRYAETLEKVRALREELRRKREGSE